MNKKTEKRIDNLNQHFIKMSNKKTPATLTDVCKLLEMNGGTLIHILRELTEIRELLELKEGK